MATTDRRVPSELVPHLKSFLRNHYPDANWTIGADPCTFRCSHYVEAIIHAFVKGWEARPTSAAPVSTTYKQEQVKHALKRLRDAIERRDEPAEIIQLAHDALIVGARRPTVKAMLRHGPLLGRAGVSLPHDVR